jgi:hypothetical protein
MRGGVKAMSDPGEQPVPKRRHWPAYTCGCLAAVAAVAAFLLLLDMLPGIWLDRHPGIAKKATCLSNISQLARAMRLYSDDYSGRIFFDDADAFSQPLVPGHYGQGYYLKKAMKKYVPDWGIWFCPVDKYAKKDFTCGAEWFGTFTYRPEGIGYVALPHSEDRDPGLRALHRELVAHYGADHMRVEHNESSYRFIPSLPGEKRPAGIDAEGRLYRREWGAYGYWDVNASNADLFEEDLSFHLVGGGWFGKDIYGKTWSFRDGHCVFRTWEMRGIPPTDGELNEPAPAPPLR